MNNPQPLVSICCITYNHAPFIRKCLDGFLMQEATFSVEILIHDDASTDGTDAIIREYTEKYPDKIFPLFEEENQYSKPRHKQLDLYNYERVRGKYIAYCEGDDYWTDPLKLQKQVDFLEAHPEYSVCVHRYSIVDENGDFICDDGSNIPMDLAGIIITSETFWNSPLVRPLTRVFRANAFDFTQVYRFKYFRDTHEFFFLLKEGNCYAMNFNGGCYRVHSGGVFSSLTKYDYCKNNLPRCREFYWKTRDNGAKKLYSYMLEECVRQCSQKERWFVVFCIIEHFIVTRSFRGLCRSIKFFLNNVQVDKKNSESV